MMFRLIPLATFAFLGCGLVIFGGQFVEGGSSGVKGGSSSQQSSWSSHQSETVSQNTCGEPALFQNGQMHCQVANTQTVCQGTCNPGYEFPDRSRQVTLSCSFGDGIWSPSPVFDDCQLLCHPPCENGGKCAHHNQCLCQTGYRGNRCQYPVSLCNQERIDPGRQLNFQCTHLMEYTECHISCPNGMAFQPYSTNQFRCTVDGLWNPPTAPRCASDSLCSQPPPPMNGKVRCSSNGQSMSCSAHCLPGYLFPGGLSELSIQCQAASGQWTPAFNFPDCEAICHPECENGGKCVGHNRCLCAGDYRGTRCQYPQSNCNARERFASVSWRCQHNERETICHVDCGHTGSKLQPTQPSEYTCSLDGSWQPDQKPICVADIDWRSQQRNTYQEHGRQEHYQQTRRHDSSQHMTSGSESWRREFGGQEQLDHDFGQVQVDHDFGQSHTATRQNQQFSHESRHGQNTSTRSQSQWTREHRIVGENSNGEDIGQRVDQDTINFAQVTTDGHQFSRGRTGERYQQNQVDYQFENEGAFGQESVDYEGEEVVEPEFTKTVVKKHYVTQGKDVEKELNLSQERLDLGGYREREDEVYQLSDEDAEEIAQVVGHERELELEDEEEGYDDLSVQLEEASHVDGICSSWGYHHYRTFDGGIYTFTGTCHYALAYDCIHREAKISMRHDCNTDSLCSRVIGIHLPENSFSLSSSKGLMQDGLQLQIPFHVGSLTVERVSRYLVARLTSGFAVWLSNEDSVHIIASPILKNKTCGLCGNYDGAADKFASGIASFANSWKIPDDDVCDDGSIASQPCDSNTFENRDISDKATLVCGSIQNVAFEDCNDLVKTDIYFRTCQLDCCSTGATRDCECASLNEYFLECARAGGDVSRGWRKAALCPMECSNGTTYKECGPPCPPTCSNLEPTCQQEGCVDGCHCPAGSVLEGGHCTPVENCPCHHGEQRYASVQTMQQDCNTCICQGGQWQCTKNICPSTCTISGPHFTTFDGTNYDLWSGCTHILVEGKDFSVQIDYGKNCRESKSVYKTCIRGLTIHTSEGAVIKIKPRMDVTVNGQEIISLPVSAQGVYVGQATSIFIRVVLNNGLELLWDGGDRIHLNAPAQLHGLVRGLCGTFTGNQKDDYLTPEGDVEVTHAAFARKWKVDESCRDEELLERLSEVSFCDRYPRKREMAEEICNLLKGKSFQDCHSSIDPEPFVASCMEDVCSCQNDPITCACLSFSTYAAACSRKNQPLPWRRDIPECGIHCAIGQVYSTCASPCSYSCAEIAHGHSNCEDVCVEGCVCPQGQTLDESGVCISVSKCSCLHSGHVYPPDYVQRRGKRMCECSEGQWDCHAATTSDLLLTPPPHVVPECNPNDQQEPTDCMSECPLTCSNFHHHQPCTTALCVPGCRCKVGYVLDASSKICVLPKNCPCHHAGRSYEDGEIVKIDCHTCTCEGGLWGCDTAACPGTCSAWGDTHFETFDGRLFDFKGECDYVMVKGRVSDDVIYSVVIQNEPCGTGGTTCGKAITVSLGDTSITLTRSRAPPVASRESRLTTRQLGLFTLVHSDIGISVQWDRDTRVHVVAQPVWKDKLQGLCGNFDDNSGDDFLPPSGGVPLVGVASFADSWRVHEFCKPASPASDPCADHPERRSWSRQKCSVLKSNLFKRCHSQVEVGEYFKRCVFDACACNSGGDCECLCAVVATYAQKCARHGIDIQWRSQHLCPIQCESCDQFSPCIPVCPAHSCDNYFDNINGHACSHEPCVDGCHPKPCMPGHVHKSTSNATCIPEGQCGVRPCIVLEGVPYREGERIRSDNVGDACQSCYCRGRKIECVGIPCSTASPTPMLLELQPECELTGWTDWINSVNPEENEGNDFEDIHALTSNKRIPCPIDHVKSVQCRVVSSQAPAETTGQKVVCDTLSGMACDHSGVKGGNKCADYELRAYCECQEEETCPQDQYWDECAFQCENTCHSLLVLLQSDGKCTDDTNCISGCSKKTCTFPYLSRDAETCVLPEMCTCILENGYILAPGEITQDGCEKCQCLNNSLVCSTLRECLSETELEQSRSIVVHPVASEESIPTVSSTIKSVTCIQGWTDWLDSHTPDEDGEREMLGDLSDFIGCDLEMVTDIQCRNTLTSEVVEYPGRSNVICDHTSGGLSCSRAAPLTCENYEIRVMCQCEEMREEMREEVREEIGKGYVVTMTSIWKTSTKKKKFGVFTTPPPCSYWSNWINKSKPKRGRKNGEKEDTLPYVLKQTEGFCLEGIVSEIECRQERTDQDFSLTREEKLMCSVEKGFLCHNRDQPDNRCDDYKIRYYCVCESAKVKPTTLIIKTTTPSFAYPCTELMPLIEGLVPIPDSQFKASSSLSSSSGPHAARMTTKNEQNRGGSVKGGSVKGGSVKGGVPKAGYESAWTAAKLDKEQFLEIDLGNVHVVYGVITEGKSEAQEWVTSYQILYSRDGLSYSYYQDEEDNIQIFNGNYDGSSKVKHIFSLPFEARYVRLEPLTWNGRISLRLELYGCAEAVAEERSEPLPFTTIIKPTSSPEIVCRDPMGLESGLILGSQLSASTFYDGNLGPDQARLGSDSAWAALVLDDLQYLQVDFIDAQNITGIVTKGCPDLPQWVTAYKVAYSSDGFEWSRLLDENGDAKEFSANFDQETKVTNILEKPIRTRFLRILPTKWRNWIALQLEILGCIDLPPCRDPMGVENELISHHQLSASSDYDDQSSAANGRLSSGTAWSPDSNDKNPFIQVDFIEPTLISGVITRGRPDAQEWVQSYNVALSNDGVTWIEIMNARGKPQVFFGNVDQNSAVIHVLPSEVTSRYIRIQPLTWKNKISMRIEVLGCYYDSVCLEPMGLENGVFPDRQISTSSSHDIYSTPEHVRLHDGGGWSPNAFDMWPYLQVDFMDRRNISALITKGKGDEDYWVTSYKILYSNDGEKFDAVMTEYNNILVFRGNSDRNSPVINHLPDMVLARYFRIIPLEFKGGIGLRLELLGCYHPYVCQEPMGMESGAIANFQLSATSYLNSATSPENARTDSGTAWAAAVIDDNQYIQVDLMVSSKITGLSTRGRNDAFEWVTEYTVAFSDDAIAWYDVRDPDTDHIMVFKANFDTDSPVTNLFPEHITARFLRVKPEKWKKWISLRVEILGCLHEEQKICMEPMGLENGLLTDSQITDSTSAYESTSPFKARLNGDSSWTAGVIDMKQFLQVDFGELRNITAIVTKGDPHKEQWVSAYKVLFSNTEMSWNPVTDAHGVPIEFPGNVDRESPHINVFQDRVEARFIRIVPTDWKNWISLRAEILGCYHPYEPRTEEPEPTEIVLGLTIVPTQLPMLFLCPDPMEKEVDLMEGAHIEVSSSSPNSNADQLFLNTHSQNGMTGGWVPEVSDLHPFVVVELPEVSWLTAIHVQGREDVENWVKTLRVIASEDNATWQPVFGPDGNEIIEGNTDQNSIVGHHFKQPKTAKFVKIIPESWHKFPSFRIGLRGCHHPEILPPSTPLPSVVAITLCPEIPEDHRIQCPSTCDSGLQCDGEKCVDPVDCQCYQNGKTYQIGDIVYGDKCHHCVCSLGGHTKCTKITCPPCKEDELSILGEECDCICEKCKVGHLLCKSNKVCIPEKLWCDGVIDCPDDELDCEGAFVTEKPLSLVTEEEIIPKLIQEENAVCGIMGKHIKTFDGQDINYDICHHVALKDIKDGSFNVTVHKECGFNNDCSHWLHVHHENNHVKVSSELKVEVDGHHYKSSQLVLLNKKPHMNITVEKVGDQVIIKLLKKGVSITYDSRAHLNIEVSPSLIKTISGLCGFYSGTPNDDQQKPNGKPAFSSRDFGDSWSVSQEGLECAPVICPHETMLKALEHCNKLRDEPFAKCGDVLPVDQFIELCMSSTCECIHHKRNGSESSCKCDDFLTFAQACESKLGPMAVRNWRLKHECLPDCPAGMEWDDCGPSCQLTCDSTSMTDFEECNGKCVPGCFCPAGTLLNEDICIPPDHCSDKVCQGFGDPHLQTFDGLFFPFQAIGTFLISSDAENSFVVEGLTRSCHFFSTTTCLIGLNITYKDQHVYIKKGHDIKLNDLEIPMHRLPIHKSNIIILGYPGRTFVVAIPQLSIEARYYEENAGFAVKVPSRRYFNKTVGLCGNCNGKKDDELKDGPVSEFVCSWLLDGSKEDCKESFVELSEWNERVEGCERLKEDVFQPCHPLVDPEIFIDACSFDASHSGDLKTSFCKTALEYSRQCCQAGVVIENWPAKYGCDFECPTGLQFHPCHSGCPQTCPNVENVTDVSICENVKVDGCFCPDGNVLKESTCVDPLLCETCDAEGHSVGDSWNVGPCKKCHCRETLSTECVVEVCPTKPICSSSETLKKMETGSEDSCCENYMCIKTQSKGCPTMEIPTCAKGEAVKLQISKSICPKYGCECDPTLCPPAVWPQDLEGGQVAESSVEGCCPSVHIFCDHSTCPEKPECTDGLELLETEGECCTIYKCRPPKDVCMYTHLFKLEEGFEVLLEPEEWEPRTYVPNEIWHDGLCENCSCVANHGQLVPFCVKEQCISIGSMPENKNYELHELKLPGKCCPDIFQVMCKDDYGNVYEAGEEWQDPDNPCITYMCEQTYLGDVHKVKNVINCTKCSKASEFIPPSKRLGQCCGICRPAKCEEGDDLFEVGESWTPEGDSCLKAQCVREAGRLRTIYTKHPCPVVPRDCPKDKIIQDESKCCQICNLTSEMSCNSSPIPVEETVGFFTYKDYFRGGLCVNENPVADVLKCSGACHSHSYYSLEDGDFKSACQCCKVNITVNRTVELRCPDGSNIRKQFLQPETCQCSKCDPEPSTKKPWAKPERIKGGSGGQKGRWAQHQDDTKKFEKFGQEPETDTFQQEPVAFDRFGQEPESITFQQEPVGFDKFGQEPESETFQQEPIRFEKFGQEPESDTFQQEPVAFEKFGQEPESDTFQQEPVAFEKFGQEPESDTFQQEPIGFDKFGQEPEPDTVQQEPIGFEKFGQEPESDTFHEPLAFEKFGQEAESHGFERIGQEPESHRFENIGQEPEPHGFGRIGQEAENHGVDKFGQEPESHDFNQAPMQYEEVVE